MLGYASKNKPDEVEFYVTNPVNKDKATFGNGTQISFLVKFKRFSKIIFIILD